MVYNDDYYVSFRSRRGISFSTPFMFMHGCHISIYSSLTERGRKRKMRV